MSIISPDKAKEKRCPVLFAALMMAKRERELAHLAGCMGPSCMNWEWVTEEIETLEFKDFDFMRANEPRPGPTTTDEDMRRMWNDYEHKIRRHLKTWEPSGNQKPRTEGWTLASKKMCEKTSAPVAIWTRPTRARKGRCRTQDLKWITDPPNDWGGPAGPPVHKPGHDE